MSRVVPIEVAHADFNRGEAAYNQRMEVLLNKGLAPSNAAEYMAAARDQLEHWREMSARVISLLRAHIGFKPGWYIINYHKDFQVLSNRDIDLYIMYDKGLGAMIKPALIDRLINEGGAGEDEITVLSSVRQHLQGDIISILGPHLLTSNENAAFWARMAGYQVLRVP